MKVILENKLFITLKKLFSHQYVKKIFNSIWIYSIAVLAISYFTYFKDFHKPNLIFWDENYYITAAQKYLDGIMFMESHPPVGKLFIALGEYILKENKDINTDELLGTSYVKLPPKDYSFKGVRLFPTLFGMFSALLFFLIIYNLTNFRFFAFLLSGLYLFENSYIIQSRSAMVDSCLIFFCLASILYFSILIKKEKISFLHYLFIGMCIGCSTATKSNGGIVALLIIFLIVKEYRKQLSLLLKKPILALHIVGKVILSGLGIFLIFFIAYYIQMALGTKPYKYEYYNASDDYKKIVEEKETSNPLNTFLIMRDNYRYIKRYHKYVPKADANGSHPTGWPLGIKSINYRWDKKDGKTSSLQFIGNPLIWSLGFIAVILSLIVVGAHFIYKMKLNDYNCFKKINVFLVLYLCYMIAVIQIERVMYLYHYLPPLLFSLILVALIFKYSYNYLVNTRDKIVIIGAVLIFIEVILVFRFFAPFTYHKPLSPNQVLQRSWFDPWELKNV